MNAWPDDKAENGIIPGGVGSPSSLPSQIIISIVGHKAASAWAIGVDSDQFLSADAAVKDVILTSALKNVNVAVFDVIDASVKGAPLTGTQVYDLKNDGVGYSKSNPAVQPYEAKADEAAAAIVAGTVTVPDKL